MRRLVTIKPGVRLHVIVTPAIVHMLQVLTDDTTAHPSLAAIEADLPPSWVITSLGDGTHGVGSQHYVGTAMDVRSKQIASAAAKQRVRAGLEAALGPTFRVLLESLNLPNEHFHLQIRKGHTFP